MFCEKCGSKLEENDAFCPQCGAKVEPKTVTPPTAVPPLPPVPPVRTQPPVPKKKSSFGIIFVILLVALVIVGVAAALLLFKDDTGSKNNTSSTTRHTSQVVTQTTEYTTTEATATTTQTVVETELMPSCIGWTIEDVQTEFEGKCRSVQFEYRYDDVVIKDRVISQNIKDGMPVNEKTDLIFVISKGKDESPEPYDQKIVVTTVPGSYMATLELFTWHDGAWESQYYCNAAIGKNGAGTNYGEGKGITPMGTYKLGILLTATPLQTVDWPYQIVTEKTCVIDDVSSPYYNTIREIGTFSSETHYDPIGQTILTGNTDRCIYIEHNGDGQSTADVVPGKGSAITICGRKSELHATAGCIDITLQDFNNILKLLDRDKTPHIQIISQ